MKTQQTVPDNVLLTLKDVWKVYKMGDVEVPALRGVSVEIKKGDFVLVMPGEIHQYRNNTAAPLVIICAVPKEYE